MSGERRAISDTGTAPGGRGIVAFKGPSSGEGSRVMSSNSQPDLRDGLGQEEGPAHDVAVTGSSRPPETQAVGNSGPRQPVCWSEAARGAQHPSTWRNRWSVPGRRGLAVIWEENWTGSGNWLREPPVFSDR